MDNSIYIVTEPTHLFWTRTVRGTHSHLFHRDKQRSICGKALIVNALDKSTGPMCPNCVAAELKDWKE